MYKIEKAGIDTTGYDSVLVGIDTGVIMTDTKSGNDYILEPTIPEDAKIIVKCDKPENLLYHLTTIHRTSADIVLTEEINEDYLFLHENGYATQLGLLYPESVEKVMKSEGISWISLRLSPLDFDLGMIKYCEEVGIKIIGVIEDTYLPETFNLSFYSRYCDIVLLPPSQNFMDRQEYLLSLVGQESPKEVEMTKSIHKPGKVDIGVSLKINDQLIIPCPSKTVLLDPAETVFCFGGFIEKTPTLEPEDELEKAVYNLWEGMERDGYNREELLNVLRYRISALLDKPYNIGKISEYAVVFVVRYGRKDIRNYIMFIKEDCSLFFSNLKNAETKE